jgi:ribonuclease BN (tRNA processing enzyme)
VIRRVAAAYHVAVTTDTTGRLRLTVLGCSTAVPHPASPAAGFLLEWEQTAVLLDVGQGVVRRLERLLDPRDLAGVVIGHMHADHYLDLAGLRYVYPWAEPAAVRLPVHLPPGGSRRLEALAEAISERPRFFDPAYDVTEYDPDDPLEIGPLTFRFVRGRHYVPAWGMAVEAPDGARLVYTGDTGPSDTMVEFARDADLLLIEAGLVLASEDDPARGHLTPEEAIDMATRAEARSTLLVHYAPARRAELDALCEAASPTIRPAVAGLVRTVAPRAEVVGRAS